MLRLMNELHDLPCVERMPHLLRGVAALLDSTVATWVDTRDFDGERSPRIAAAVDVGWSTASERELLLEYLKDDHAQDPLLVGLMDVEGAFFTRSREQLVRDSEWYQSRYVMDYRRPARVDDDVASVRRVGRDRMYALSVHGAWGKKRFGRRDRLLLHLFHGELGWLYRDLAEGEGASRRKFTSTSGVVVHLSPREEQVIGKLLAGRAEKEIANELGLKRPTVHDYITSIYRKMGVGSQPQLMAHCFKVG